MITTLRQGQSNEPHPHGIENGWIWIANFVNIDPIPDICPTLLQEFLRTAGSEMLLTYKSQFQKLLLLIQQQYIPLLEKVDAGGPKARLEELINEILKTGKIEPPAGRLAPNFW